MSQIFPIFDGHTNLPVCVIGITTDDDMTGEACVS